MLFIEGFEQVGDFYVAGLLGLPASIPGVPSNEGTKLGWRGVSVKRLSCSEEQEPGALAMDVCRQEISSGKYNAIVVADLSYDHSIFEKELGAALKSFAERGGAVAFPTSEGGNLAPTLDRLFGTGWTASGYYRTNWAVCAENRERVSASFGAEGGASFSVKACSLRNVPPHERCFGVTEESRTQSHVPFMAGADVSKPAEPDSVTAAAAALDADYDCCVAMHAVGQGKIAYFGDVNVEDATGKLVCSWVVTNASWPKPVPAWTIPSSLQLVKEKFDAAMGEKTRGNAAFGTSQFDEALRHYGEALRHYGEAIGSATQREEKVKISSNRAECLLRLERWGDAEAAASDALELAPAHPKSLLRRAKALMGQVDEKGGPADSGDSVAAGELLYSAGKDLRLLMKKHPKGDGVGAARVLLEQVSAREREYDHRMEDEPCDGDDEYASYPGYLGGKAMGCDEMGSYGFTQDEEMELLSQGVKPWDEDARDVLAALNGDGGDFYDDEY